MKPHFALWYGHGLPSDPLAVGAGVELVRPGLIRVFVKDGAARNELTCEADVAPYDSIRISFNEAGVNVFNIDRRIARVNLPDPHASASWPVGGEAKGVVLP